MAHDPTRFDLDALEFQVVRDLLTERLTTPLGRSAVATLAPQDSVAAVAEASTRVRELADRLGSGAQAPLSGVVEVHSWLASFFAGERVPETRELADLKRVLRAAHRCKAWLPEGGPASTRCAGEFPDVRDLADELETVLDDRGEVLTTASQKLAGLRQEIESAEVAVRHAVQRFLGDDSVRKALVTSEPSWRHGRPVFQVKPDQRHRVPGVLHDRSSSGQTLFVEPSVVVDAANRLSDAKAAEQREITVVLAHVCRGLVRCQREITGAIAAVAQLDLRLACARLVAQDGFTIAEVRPGGTLRVRRGRHPLLVRRGAGVVPLDLALGDPYRMVVVTGPNTGGKTVVLKTVGVLAAMALSGVPVPAASGTEFPFLDGLFADIGDEQAISQNLSTFSSHVKRIVRCIGGATANTLVLLDELGAGTDPEEGGALGYAVLEDLERRGCFALVTTHIGRLKDFAHQHKGAQNGAMTFDGATLRPLYQLEVGIPGSSHALDIAGKVGVPEAIVARARALLGRRDRRLEDVIESVQSARREAEADRARVADLTATAEAKEKRIAELERELEKKSAWLEEEADAMVSEEMRAAQGLLQTPLKELVNAPRPFGDKAKALLDVLGGLLRGSSLHRRRLAFVATLDKESVVFLPRLRRRAIVKKVDRVREILTVELGKLRMEVPFEDVSWLAPLDGT